MINRYCILLILQSFFSISVISQNRVKPFLKSDDLINEGLKLHDAGKYDDAIAKYKLINRNDSNYVYAMSELAYSYYANKQHNAAIDLCKLMLKNEKKYRYMFYNILGNSLDELNRSEEAITVYKQGLTELKYQHLLAFNLGITYNKLENADSALYYFQKAVLINPYHASSHLQMALIALKQGRIPHALMAFSFFLTIEPTSSRAHEVILMIDKVASDEYEFDKSKLVDPSKFKDDNFDEIADLIKTKIALGKKYKSISKLEFPISKQMQLILEKLKYNENDKGFFMQYYVPFFKDMWEKNQFKTFAYYQLASVNIEKVQKWLTANKSKTNAYEKWAGDFINKQKDERGEWVNGKLQKLKHWYYKGNTLEALGNKNAAGKFVGDWIFYYYEGTISAEGTYNDKGERTGEWKWYYSDGTLQEKTNYKIGMRDGITELYYANGVLMRTITYKMDKREGQLNEYYSTGELKTEGLIVNEKSNGLVKYYYPNGKIMYEVNYKDDELDGSFVQYYDNGNLDTKVTFEKGKKQGKGQYYYPNGKLEQEGDFKDNKQMGEWTFYYDDGTLKRKAKFNDKGGYIGDYKEYHRNGKIKFEITYTANSKPDGPYKEYAKNGTLWSELYYKGEQLQSYKYFDYKGNIISQGEKNGKKIQVISKYQNGNKKAEGEFLGTDKDGEWKYYDVYGNLSSVENYKADKLNGTAKKYYDNGNLHSEKEYVDGQLDGYSKYYYTNGILKTEGWFKDGAEQGEWVSYFLNGKIKEREYFEQGSYSGFQEYYNPQGYKHYELIYKYGFLNGAIYYDSTGKITDDIKFMNGDGDYIVHFPNGKEYVRINYKNGLAEGNSTFFSPSGTVIETGTYLNDKKTGLWKGYHDNGNLEFENNYFDGYLNGVSRRYHENGNISSESNFHNSDYDGARKTYYDNKQIEKESYYEDDKAEGVFAYYSPEGILMNKRNFETDMMLTYTYIGKDGNMVPDITIQNETGKMVTYYQNGKKSQEQEFLNGYLIGKKILYFSTGAIFKEDDFKDGYQTGVSKEYYLNGSLKREENYFVDQLHGEAKYYYDNGKLKETGQYVYGEKHGEWHVFDKAGKLILIKYYSNGVWYDEKKK